MRSVAKLSKKNNKPSILFKKKGFDKKKKEKRKEGFRQTWLDFAFANTFDVLIVDLLVRFRSFVLLLIGSKEFFWVGRCFLPRGAVLLPLSCCFLLPCWAIAHSFSFRCPFFLFFPLFFPFPFLWREAFSLVWVLYGSTRGSGFSLDFAWFVSFILMVSFFNFPCLRDWLVPRTRLFWSVALFEEERKKERKAWKKCARKGNARKRREPPCVIQPFLCMSDKTRVFLA